ncbi:transcriptional regulator, MarR family [Rubrobacter xylanophilus DSM 9941]|uniref:Transcriptional regulator, MarR family n=1 Tax=Rubrobacter xylanophilus (strain DSM 9941 / JCM 11954 / NBRC 16129 / PRD-1) TaxID=266117 RepID=Q1AU75_RUBXD|nr:transcriptional regulator, MarR family [Rubrobacter xylanophilus DSM 9941]
MGELAREFGVAPATVSGAVAALERKGLVRRRSSPGDGRAVALALTPRGGALARELAAWDLPLRRRLAELPSGQKEGALWLLLRLIDGLQEEGAITVSGMCVSCRYFRPHAHPGAARPHHCALLDAPLGVGELRLDCPDHEPAAAG